MSRLLDDLRAVVLACIPTSPFWVPRRFRVLKMNTGDHRVELQAVTKALGLPDVLPVSVSPGMAGLEAKLTPGTIVVVQFVDGDPSLPIITHFASADDSGFLPVELFLDATLKVQVGQDTALLELGKNATVTRIADGIPIAQGVARMGDTVQAGPFGGAVTGASAKVSAG